LLFVETTFKRPMVLIPVIIIILISYYLFYNFLAFKSLRQLKEKLILITGCDTGFGNMTAKKLDSIGCIVIATCLNEKNAIELKKQLSQKALIFVMDVTNVESIKKVALEIDKYCEEHSTYLFGLVNNAGIFDCSPFECIEENVFNKILQVNMIGVANCCREFIPLIRKKN